MTKKKLKVFTFFGYINDIRDPYLSRLYGALKKEGVDSSDMSRPLKVFGSNIIHLHWIEYYILSKSRGLTFLKWMVFPLLLLALKHIFRKQIVVTLHNVQSHSQYFPKFEKFGFKFYLKYIADKVIIFHSGAKKEAEKKYGLDPKKVFQTPPFSYTNYYKNIISRKDARKKLGIPEKKLVFLVFGRLWKYKGIYDVIEFLKKEGDRDYVVIIAGRPENEEVRRQLLELKEHQKKKVILKLGFIDDDDLQIYINACDAGWLPYKKASASGPVVIFGCFKRTCVSKDLSSFREVMKKDGIYYKNNKDLKKKVSLLRADDLKQRGKRFYENVSKITWENIAKETLKVYNE